MNMNSRTVIQNEQFKCNGNKAYQDADDCSHPAIGGSNTFLGNLIIKRYASDLLLEVMP